MVYKTITGLFLIVLTVSATISEPPVYNVSAAEGEIIVRGTSSLHDWDMTLRQLDCDVSLSNEGNLIKSIEKVVFTCKASDIKSDNKIMDRKAQYALKSDIAPEIKFVAGKATDLVANGNKFSGKLTGRLTVAGESRDITVPFEGTISDNYLINVEGKADLKMSDFRIVPPTALMGTLKTGDEISVIFSLRLRPDGHRLSKQAE
jgi:polyisoprenoid-binding protein YceI